MARDGENSTHQQRGIRYARELEGHLGWLDTFSGTALGVLAVASGIYTYLGVSSLLDDNGAMSAFAAIAYSAAVSVGIFVFWSYMLRLFPAVRSARARVGLLGAMSLGAVAIIAMSSWLNAAALAGSAAVEQHLAETVQDYQGSLERAHEITLSAQGLERDVARVRQSFEDLRTRGHRRAVRAGRSGRCVSRAAPEIGRAVGAGSSDRHPDATGERRLCRGQPDPKPDACPYC